MSLRSTIFLSGGVVGVGQGLFSILSLVWHKQTPVGGKEHMSMDSKIFFKDSPKNKKSKKH